jgi:signal transduction histidine kinase
MSRMVEDLLVLARSEQSDFLDVRPIDVAELTHELAAKASALGDRGWTVEAAAPVVLLGDRQRLTQAMMNLASNAAQHTTEGTTVTLGSRAIAGNVMLWVSDNGEGIAVADRERIFDRFARGHVGRRRTDGTGLGLAIVKAIAEAHGGVVRLDSTPGAKTTFTLVLPAGGPEGGGG